MKTAEEVKAWLEKQDWYKEFCHEVDKCNDTENRNRILNGKVLDETITGAFDWLNAEKTLGIWADRNREFKDWFKNPTPEQMDKNITELILDADKTSFKNDRKDNKPRWELLPLEVIEEAVKVYTFGAEKYEANSWQHLENGQERYYAALMRHLVAWRKGEKVDEESGLSPLAHVLWNSIALLWFEMNENK